MTNWEFSVMKWNIKYPIMPVTVKDMPDYKNIDK